MNIEREISYIIKLNNNANTSLIRYRLTCWFIGDKLKIERGLLLINQEWISEGDEEYGGEK